MTDKITVIEQTTADRNKETQELYENCLPYLKQGLTLRQAVAKVQNKNYTCFSRFTWYKELLTYAKNQGYNGY